MEFENLIKLIETVSGSELTDFRYEENGVRIRMARKKELQSEVNRMMEAGCPDSFPGPVLQENGSVEKGQKTEGAIVSSPLVGVFYEAPAEDAAPFVSVGDTVKKGQVLAIVEAMKLMNEIECETDGVIAEIYVKNGTAVEYGQPLFRIV